MPDGPLGDRLRQALLGVGTEIWSAPAAPVQHAAALAFTEPAQITARIAASRSLHATVARHGGRMYRRRAAGPASAGRVLPLPRLRTLAGTPAHPAPGDHRARPGPAAAGPLRRCHPARQRLRRTPWRAAATAGHR